MMIILCTECLCVEELIFCLCNLILLIVNVIMPCCGVFLNHEDARNKTINKDNIWDNEGVHEGIGQVQCVVIRS